MTLAWVYQSRYDCMVFIIMDYDDIRELVEAISASIDVAPIGQLYESRGVSLDFLMEFGALGSDEHNPESVLIREEESVRFKRIIEAFNHSITTI